MNTSTKGLTARHNSSQPNYKYITANAARLSGGCHDATKILPLRGLIALLTRRSLKFYGGLAALNMVKRICDPEAYAVGLKLNGLPALELMDKTNIHSSEESDRWCYI